MFFRSVHQKVMEKKFHLLGYVFVIIYNSQELLDMRLTEQLSWVIFLVVIPSEEAEMQTQDILFKEVKVHKVSDEIVRQIMNLITGGALKPGDKLPSERSLVDMLGVGRSSLREAMSILETMGLVEIRKRKGNYVKGINTTLSLDPLKRILQEEPEKIDDFYEIRNDIELASVCAAAKNRTEKDLAIIRETFPEQQGGVFPPIFPWNRDRDFHMAIAMASHNFIRAHVVNHFFDFTRDINEQIFSKLVLDQEKGALIMAQHQAIYDAIEARDCELAQEQMQNHLSWINKTIHEYADI